MTTLTKIDLQYEKIASGKVRELYRIPGSESLLFITTDRISCFDVILETGIPEKGAILTRLSSFWFQLLQARIPNLRTHLLTLGIPPSLQTIRHLPRSNHSPFAGNQDQVLYEEIQKRSMIVQRLKVFPIESIVRGYITGSAWASYKKDGTMHGVTLPEGLQESQKFDKPVWTPSTKAEQGVKDENISPEEAASIIRQTYPEDYTEYAARIEELSLAIYHEASVYAAERGIIIADTKLEFALDESTSPPSVVLVDEVLTPDSSRFWSAEKYEVGRPQDSLDKQFVRDWLIDKALKGKEGVKLPREIVERTSATYIEAYEMLVGEKWRDEVTFLNSELA
ncbi:MAG: Bifunctional purine biosynthetic protein ade1 [Heterodermia speciosa]|uniref:Phosphoribosylaminoimidazole-succinocarboxamide synthase n=1 Tax=Heterodermia speciosa TaxID=116794 RepID=A0A8H3FAG0_9LECA|nr:MAG: Bifunctional purine biosynthetic protein ade1 [Heterodermia speciosa]